MAEEFRWLQWFSARAARFGHAGSIFMLGALIERRGGSIIQANRYYRLAADKGNVDAMWHLGVNYLGTKGGKREEPLAVFWIAAAAEKWHPMACWALGRMHLAGRLVPKDHERAVELLKRAAVGGNRDAAAMVATMHREGQFGVVQDEAEARFWASCGLAGRPGARHRRTARARLLAVHEA